MKPNIDHLLQQGIVAHKQGKLQEAEHIYRSILQTQPTHADANHYLGFLAASMNKFEVALPFFKTAIEENPNIEQFWISYINALMKKKQFEKAESTSRKAIELNPKFARVHCNLGSILQALNRLEECIISYKKAIQLKPEYALAHNNLGATLKKLGKLEEAEASYKKAVHLNPNYVVAHYNLGNTLYKLTKFKEAELSYRNTIALNANHVVAYNNLGATLKELGKLDEAMANSKKAIELKPDYAEAYSNLSDIQQDLGKLNEAVSGYKKVITLKPDYVVAHNNLGNALNELGRLEEAEASYKKAIELKPDYILAHDNLTILLKQKKLLNILKIRKPKEKIKSGFTNIKTTNPGIGLTSIPFISNRSVEAKLLKTLYKINSTELKKTKGGPLFGSGRTSDYQLFENNSSIIKILEKDLISIMRKAVKSEIYIIDSFFNILGSGGGSIPHTHLNSFDKVNELSNQKYSLTYYLSVGDQYASEPGIFKIYDPDEEILPSSGMVMIIPAGRKHSAIYSGKKDRVMIGVNFYSII